MITSLIDDLVLGLEDELARVLDRGDTSGGEEEEEMVGPPRETDQSFALRF